MNQDIGIPVDLVSTSDDCFLVKNIPKIIAIHNKHCRTCNGKEFPNIIDGVFQRKNYFADADSSNSKWIQYLLLEQVDVCVVKVAKRYDSMITFYYDDECYNTMVLEYVTTMY
jgi:hypothetical protein